MYRKKKKKQLEKKLFEYQILKITRVSEEFPVYKNLFY